MVADHHAVVAEAGRGQPGLDVQDVDVEARHLGAQRFAEGASANFVMQ
jgi:hypothetical protein